MPPWADALITFAAAILGAMLTVWVYHSRKKRDEGAAEERARLHLKQTETMWRRVDELRRDLEVTRTQLAVLGAQMGAMPSHDTLRERIGELREALERRLDMLSEQLTLLLRDRA